MCKGISGMAQLTEGGVSMERLTKRVDGSLVFPSELIGIMMTPSNDAMYQILTRLAAYEDSGLEPEDLKKAFNETAILKLAAQALSTTPDHLRDLIQAEQDGRLVVLDEPMRPMVWGDKEHDTILCPRCLCDLMGGFEFAPSCETMMFQCPHCGQPIASDKAITMEDSEAEAALKGGEG